MKPPAGRLVFALTRDPIVAKLLYMSRLLCVLVLVPCLVAAGCKSEPEQQELIWEGVKIGELAPPPRDRLPSAQFLGTLNMDIHVFDLPADNVEKLDEVWQVLSANPIRMNSYNAFTQNSFRIRFGRPETLEQVFQLLIEADGQRAGTITTMVADTETSDVTIAELPVNRQITFVGTNLSKQTVNVGYGLVVLRLKAEPVPWARGIRKIVAYPTYTMALPSTIPELREQNRQYEFYFGSAAFACEMGPGDFVVLGPDEYTGERLSLGGLFFSYPEGALFFNPTKRKPPEHKPAARVYILVCTGVID